MIELPQSVGVVTAWLGVTVLAAIAMASLVLSAIGLLVARGARRSALLRHGVLLSALCALCMLPAAPFAASWIEVDWLPRLQVLRFSQDLGATGSASASVNGVAGAELHAAQDVPDNITAQLTATNSTLTTLSAEEIPAGAILPGQVPGATGSASVSASQSAGNAPRSTSATLSPGITAAGISTAAVGLWFLGTLVSLVRTLRAASGVARLVRHSTPVADALATALLAELSTAMRLRRPPQLRSTARIRVPFAWGLARPVVVVPQHLLEPQSTDRVRPILIHELAHVRRRDVWIGTLQRVVAALYWWNPLVHVVNSRLADAREEICDAHVVAGGCPSRDYAEILVDLATQISLPQPAAALGLLSRSQPQLTRRVQHLLEDQPMSTSLHKLARVTLLGFFSVLIVIGIFLAGVLVDNGGFLGRRQAYDFPFANWLPRSTDAAYGQVHSNYVSPQPVFVTATQPASQSFATPTVPAPAGAAAAPVFGGGAMLVQQPTSDDDPFGAAPGTDLDADMILPPGATVVADPLDAAQPSADELAQRPAGGGRATLGREQDEGDSFPTPARSGRGAAMMAPPARMMMGGMGMAGRDNDEDGSMRGVATAIPRAAFQGLAVIELLGNDDGSLNDIRWFTESLGTGEDAITKLAERVTEFASRSAQGITVNVPAGTDRVAVGFGLRIANEDDNPFVAPRTDGGGARSAALMFGTQGNVQLAAQVTASGNLRYEHVARVVALCQPHVQRVILAEPNLTSQITLTLGFVRDGSGKQISSSPVLIWNNAVTPVVTPAPTVNDDFGGSAVVAGYSDPHDEIVTVEQLTGKLLQWRQIRTDEDSPKTLTATIRADTGVDPKLVEQVVQVTLPDGVERVILQPLAGQEPQPAPDSQAEDFFEPPQPPVPENAQNSG